MNRTLYSSNEFVFVLQSSAGANDLKKNKERENMKYYSTNARKEKQTNKHNQSKIKAHTEQHCIQADSLFLALFDFVTTSSGGESTLCDKMKDSLRGEFVWDVPYLLK